MFPKYSRETAKLKKEGNIEWQNLAGSVVHTVKCMISTSRKVCTYFRYAFIYGLVCFFWVERRDLEKIANII